MTEVRPYGSWPSPVSTERLVEKAVRLSALRVDGADLYWLERRPSEAGRQVIVRHGAGDASPTGHSARTLVHEYGGGDYTVAGGRFVFSDFASQRIHVEAVPLTPDDGSRYADFDVHPDRGSVACVRERHLEGGMVVNDVVVVDLETGATPIAAEGHDFYAAPRWAPDGRLAWLEWDHPNMPWDGTWLVVDRAVVAGGVDESISQPRWSPDGVLHWVSDRTDWWNLYADGMPVAPTDAEFTFPDWAFGGHTYDWLPDGRIAAVYTSGGLDHLAVVEDGTVRTLDVPWNDISSLVVWQGKVALIAASGTTPEAVVTVDVDSGAVDTLRPSRDALDPRDVSLAEPIEFPTEGGRTAHALFYPPVNHAYVGPDGQLPPLVVMIHGGPTGAAAPGFDIGVQYFTTRGIAVVDVNYGGSTGYGRQYRRRLDGQWGVVDVEDCAHAARWLATEGRVDGARLAIRGGSAGGYTTLCALTFRDDFAVGASFYGVADAEALAAETHKFESRYLDRLIGPYPEAKELYRERSPIHAAERLRVPVIILQGLEDKVVPPDQAEVMVAALRANGVEHEYIAFEGEQHGFRQADTIKRAAEAELRFYGRVLGFDPVF